MVNWKIVNTRIGLPGIETTDTTQADIKLGYVVQAEHATRGTGTFIYLSGIGSTAVGSWVLFSEDDFSTSLLAAGDIGQVAIAMAANIDSQYGWYQVVGKASGKGLSGLDADNANVYSTSTGGSVDDAIVAGDRVKRTKTASAVSGGLADFEIFNPYVDDGLAA